MRIVDGEVNGIALKKIYVVQFQFLDGIEFFGQFDEFMVVGGSISVRLRDVEGKLGKSVHPLQNVRRLTESPLLHLGIGNQVLQVANGQGSELLFVFDANSLLEATCVFPGVEVLFPCGQLGNRFFHCPRCVDAVESEREGGVMQLDRHETVVSRTSGDGGLTRICKKKPFPEESLENPMNCGATDGIIVLLAPSRN